MLIEYAQLMSTAHRMLDGQHGVILQNGRRKQIWTHPEFDDRLYKATHVNHPSNIWVRSSRMAYFYTFNLWEECARIYAEYSGRQHATYERLRGVLMVPPGRIADTPAGAPPQCMDEQYKQTNTVEAYRAMYRHDKVRFATFKYNGTPQFMEINDVLV